MAQIRLGSGGQAVPGRAPQIQTPAGAFGAGTAQAIGELGRAAAGVSLDIIAEQTRARDEETKRQKAQAEAVERAKEGAALHETQDQLRDLHDQIGEQVLTGQIPRDQAEKQFGEQSKTIIDGSMERFRPESRQIVAPRLQADVSTLGNGVRRLVEKRGKQEVTAAISQSLEYFERLYPTDRAKAEDGAAGVLQAMGPWSDMSPEQLARAGQGWKERTQFNTAQRAVNAARRDNAALDAAAKALDDPQFADLDPSRKGQLLTQVEAYKVANAQKAEADARRREAEQDRILKRAESQFNAAQSILTTGKVLSPDYVEQVSQAVAGTPYQAAFAEALKSGPERTAFGVRPLAEQEQMLRVMRGQLNQQGTNPKTEKMVSELEKVHTEAVKDYARDPMVASLDRGLLQELAPLSITDLATLPAALAARQQQASVVAQQTGRPVSPFTAQEAEQVGQMLTNMPAADRSRYVATLAQAVGPQAAGAVAQQIDKKDRALGLAFAMAGSATTAGRLTSELVLKGSQAKKDGTSTKGDKQPDVKAARWKATAAASISDVFPVQGMTDAYTDAAELIMHGIAAEQGGRLTERDMERAVELAIGGKLVEHNGRKTPLPAGIDEDALDKRLRSVAPDEIGSSDVIAGGVKVPTSEWVKTLPGAELIYAGPGRYSVIVKGRPVTKPDGKRVVIGVTQ